MQGSLRASQTQANLSITWTAETIEIDMSGPTPRASEAGGLGGARAFAFLTSPQSCWSAELTVRSTGPAREDQNYFPS